MAVKELNKERFEQALQSEKPLLAEFWAPWCGYCRRIAPAYERVAAAYENELLAGRINIDEEPALEESQHIEIIPTLILYKNGQAVDSIVNPGSQAAIDRFVREALEK